MTTNQTIDGVPRELEPCPFCGGEADLKCTDGDYPDWFVQCTECHASVDVFGPGAVHHWNGRKLPAAQPQGEPVAWQYRVSAGPQTGWSLWHDGKGEEFKQSYQVETRPLYTEQPALVAVVMPERREIGPNYPYLSDLDIEWNACLDDLKRLNPSL